MTGLLALLFLSTEVWIGGALSILLLGSVPALITAIVLFLFLPETKDRTYEKIREQLKGMRFYGLKRSVTESQMESGAKGMSARPKYERLLYASSYASYGSTTLRRASHTNVCNSRRTSEPHCSPRHLPLFLYAGEDSRWGSDCDDRFHTNKRRSGSVPVHNHVANQPKMVGYVF